MAAEVDVRIIPIALLLALAGAVALAEDEPSLKEFLKDDAVADGWIYEDIEAGYQEAAKTGKPLLVCFSCVP